ncbi:6-phosphofructokinase 1 [Alteromonadaceae bacterium 2753L.S.0a.02]|nr:6-phosphofructokinase 1 [Alteromonadaceae bacterium 2753L.S.0a.02]
MTTKKLLVLTGGGDCPGLNAVIRGIAKRASLTNDWEVWGSLEAFNGILNDTVEVVKLTGNPITAGIHAKGGTILGTTTKGGPFAWPVKMPDGSWGSEDRSDFLVSRCKELGFNAVVSIGGDGSQRISKILHDKGMNVIGVPKTIDNDLSATDYTFGFQTAVQEASNAVDKLVTTAESHHRVMILEVMGRSAGWIALHSAIAGGAEICLIPEIPYDINKVLERVNSRYCEGRGFVIIVIAEGAAAIDGQVVAQKSIEVGNENLKLGGVGNLLADQLREHGCTADTRVTVLGHLQRGGSPIAFDRVLATQFGVKAFEMVLNNEFGRMVAFKNNDIISVSLEEATGDYNYVNTDSYLVQAARGVGISFGD